MLGDAELDVLFKRRFDYQQAYAAKNIREIVLNEECILKKEPPLIVYEKSGGIAGQDMSSANGITPRKTT